MKSTTRFRPLVAVTAALCAISYVAQQCDAAIISATSVGTVIDGGAGGYGSQVGFNGPSSHEIGDSSGVNDQEAVVWGKFSVVVPSGEYISSALLEFGGFSSVTDANGPGLSGTPATGNSWLTSEIENDYLGLSTVPGDIKELRAAGSVDLTLASASVSSWFGTGAFLPATGTVNFSVAMRRDMTPTTFFDNRGSMLIANPTFQINFNTLPIPIPEPTSLAILSAGIIGVVALRRRVICR